MSVPDSSPVGVYLDSDPLIRFVEGGVAGLPRLLERAAEGRLRLYTSELALAEVLVIPLREGRHELVSFYGRLLTAGPLLQVVPIDRELLRATAENRAVLRNKGQDAIHVATAQRVAATIFVSTDKRIKLPDFMTRVQAEAVVSTESLA